MPFPSCTQWTPPFVPSFLLGKGPDSLKVNQPEKDADPFFPLATGHLRFLWTLGRVNVPGILCGLISAVVDYRDIGVYYA